MSVEIQSLEDKRPDFRRHSQSGEKASEILRAPSSQLHTPHYEIFQGFAVFENEMGKIFDRYLAPEQSEPAKSREHGAVGEHFPREAAHHTPTCAETKT